MLITGTCVFNASRYIVAVEQHLHSETSHLSLAFQLMFQLYYVYIMEAPVTLEFLQRYLLFFLGKKFNLLTIFVLWFNIAIPVIIYVNFRCFANINPTQGSKVKKIKGKGLMLNILKF